jgi:signal peptidase I
LFVDRMSYHFVRPSVGDGFVFNTKNIAVDPDKPHMEQYYIKRLVGLPGDTLEIKNFTLYRNGRPIEGAAAFAKNARRDGDYVGYRNLRGLAVGQTMTVPPDGFLALGDNSANSADGRYWGFVPAKDAVGRPLFIYFPFTRRWGPAR